MALLFRLFGWNEDSTMDMGPMGTYRIFNNGGAPVGAVMTRDPSKSPAPVLALLL